MELWIDVLIVVLVLTNFKLISSSRLSACIRVVAVQGVLLGVLPLFVGEGVSHAPGYGAFGGDCFGEGDRLPLAPFTDA